MADSPEDEIPVMVAITRAPSKPQYKCVLVDKNKKLAVVFQQLEAEDHHNRSSGAPSVKLSSSETGATCRLMTGWLWIKHARCCDQIFSGLILSILRLEQFLLLAQETHSRSSREPPLPRKVFLPSTQSQSMACLSYLTNWLIFAKIPTLSSGNLK